MMIKKTISCFLALAFAICSFQTIAFAENKIEETAENITIEFHNEVSDEVKERMIVLSDKFFVDLLMAKNSFDN